MEGQSFFTTLHPENGLNYLNVEDYDIIYIYDYINYICFCYKPVVS